MKRFHFVLLGLLLAIGATCFCVAGQHRAGNTLILYGNSNQKLQKKVLQQQGKKSVGTPENQQQIRRLRIQRDSLTRIIQTLEKQPISNTRKKLTRLRSERDLLSKKITQLTKTKKKNKEKGKGEKDQPSNKAIFKKQQPAQRTQKTVQTKLVTTLPKKTSDKIEKIISKLDANEKQNAKAEPPVTGESRKQPTVQQKKIPITASQTPIPAASTSGTASTTTRTATVPSTTAPVMLRWPVDSRKILLEYGERYNPQTNTVTINPGINIRVDDDSEVSSAESGNVSMVTWMPGYRTVVIVDHGGGCRTVYANLSSATVKRGAKLRRGDKIGTVSKSQEGRYLHFQVWKERQRMNPMTMLR